MSANPFLMRAAARIAAAVPLAAELRVARPEQPLSGRWQRIPVEPGDGVPLGISFRPLQAQALGLDPGAVLEELLGYPSAVIAWQVEHEAVDPLGMEHSWRLSAEFAAAEVTAARAADPSRPVLLNGFLPATAPVAAAQWWRTRDQGDSLAVAARLADTVGIDYYPRHALAARGRRTVYLDGTASRLGPERYRNLARRAAGRHSHADGHREGEHAACLCQRDQAFAADLPGDQRRP
jgi:hypothetical protein